MLWYTYDLFIRLDACESDVTELISVSEWYFGIKLEFSLHQHHDNDISVMRMMVTR